MIYCLTFFQRDGLSLIQTSEPIDGQRGTEGLSPIQQVFMTQKKEWPWSCPIEQRPLRVKELLRFATSRSYCCCCCCSNVLVLIMVQ